MIGGLVGVIAVLAAGAAELAMAAAADDLLAVVGIDAWNAVLLWGGSGGE